MCCDNGGIVTVSSTDGLCFTNFKEHTFSSFNCFLKYYLLNYYSKYFITSGYLALEFRVFPSVIDYYGCNIAAVTTKAL